MRQDSGQNLKIRKSDMKIHKQITEIKESPLFMKFNPIIETRLPPIKLFSNAGEEFLEMSYD